MYSFPCATIGNVVARLHDLVGDHLHFFVDFVEAASHETLDRINRVFGIGDRLPFGDLPNQPLPGLGECDDRRGSPAAFFIRDDLGLAALHHGDAGVGGSQVNSDNLGHKILSLDKCCLALSSEPPALSLAPKFSDS